MNDKHEISDELLTKYVSGHCTEAEEAEVLDYMAQNDEHVDDLLNIVAAIESQKKADALNARPKTHRAIPWAAAASLLLVVGLAWFFVNRGSAVQIEQAPYHATQDTFVPTDTVTSQMLPYNEE